MTTYETIYFDQTIGSANVSGSPYSDKLQKSSEQGVFVNGISAQYPQMNNDSIVCKPGPCIVPSLSSHTLVNQSTTSMSSENHMNDYEMSSLDFGTLRLHSPLPSSSSNLFQLHPILRNHMDQLPAAFISRFTLIAELGHGGCGFACLAYDQESHSQVCIKFIWKSKVSKSGWVWDTIEGSQHLVPLESFFLRHMHHDGIVKYIDSYDSTDFYILIMEYHGSIWQKGVQIPSFEKTRSDSNNSDVTPPGSPMLAASSSYKLHTPSPASEATLYSPQSPTTGLMQLDTSRPPTDLFEAIEKVGFFTESQARHMFQQICQSVDYLHNTCGIVHRDIKDENVVVDTNLTVKLIDLGNSAFIPCRSLAQQASGQSTTRTGTPLDHHSTSKYFTRFYGTMHYAAPEILKGYAYRGPEADCFSLGILLYTILCGELPFADADQTIRLRFAPMKYQRSRECVDLVSRLLEKDPIKRITVEQVLQHPWMRE
jgi:serine/threonine protein kinase